MCQKSNKYLALGARGGLTKSLIAIAKVLPSLLIHMTEMKILLGRERKGE